MFTKSSPKFLIEETLNVSSDKSRDAVLDASHSFHFSLAGTKVGSKLDCKD